MMAFHQQATQGSRPTSVAASGSLLKKQLLDARTCEEQQGLSRVRLERIQWWSRSVCDTDTDTHQHHTPHSSFFYFYLSVSVSKKGMHFFGVSKKGMHFCGVSKKGMQLFSVSKKGMHFFRVSKKGMHFFFVSKKGFHPNNIIIITL